MSATVTDLVKDYAAAVSDGDFERLARLVHPNATFGGTVMSEAEGAEAFVQGFRNLRPITVRTDVREVIVENDRAAVLYDLVTDTPVGSVLCSEFLEIDQDQIMSSTLVFDWRRWPEVLTEIRSRTAGPPESKGSAT
ncbi:MAG: nuclear transport factor 2 family protein [Acidimicrobiales bacterium]